MSGSHYYHPSTGALIEGGLREARKCEGLPSPTTVLSLIKGEGLIRYLQRQMHEASVTTPRLPQMTDEEHYNACLRWSDEHSKTARERGGDFHTLIQHFHMAAIGQDAMPPVVSHYGSQFDAYLRWYETYVKKTLAVEQFVKGDGYAGRMDHMALMADGRVAVLDIKSQDITKRKRFNYYPEWSIQLGAYAGAVVNAKVDCLISIVVSSSQPAVLESYTWPGEVSYYHDLFLGLLKVWNLSNNYWPTPQAQPELVP